MLGSILQLNVKKKFKICSGGAKAQLQSFSFVVGKYVRRKRRTRRTSLIGADCSWATGKTLGDAGDEVTQCRSIRVCIGLILVGQKSLTSLRAYPRGFWSAQSKMRRHTLRNYSTKLEDSPVRKALSDRSNFVPHLHVVARTCFCKCLPLLQEIPFPGIPNPSIYVVLQ